MVRITYIIILAMLLLAACSDPSKNQETSTKMTTEPIAKKQDSVLSIHGHTRIDPYFWMRLTDEQKIAETPDAQTQEVLNYLDQENQYVAAKLKDTEALQTKLFEEITGRIKQTDESVPYFKNHYWYYTKYEEGQEYPIYCRKKESLDAEEEIMINVNQLAKGYDYYSASGLNISPDNHILAYAEDTLSRRVYTYRFLDLRTGEHLPDVIPYAAPGGAWAKDNKTFFYTTKNKTTLLSEKIWKHQLNSNTQNDQLIFQEQDPTYYIRISQSNSGDYIFITKGSTEQDHYLILDADDPNGTFKDFTPLELGHKYRIYHFKDKFYILTNDQAKNFRLMETMISSTDRSNWKEVIAHRDDVLLESIEVFDNYLVVNERANALNQIRIINQNSSEEHYLSFEEPAYVVVFGMNPEFNTTKLRYYYSSLATPSSVYEYEMDSRTKKLLKQDEVVGGHDPKQYITKREFAEARDGTKIPISIVYKKGTPINGQSPVLQYAYGSYGSSTDPTFSSVRLSLIDRGFIFVIAHVRGGQEMGRQWYEDGKMFKKQNTFNDFEDVSRYLIAHQYTSPEHLYASGGSAGGLLMGAILNQAPQLYNGVMAAVPFVDVVSTMLDESIPLTTGEFDEWGNPKNKDSYEYMLSYSPYDQVKAQDYPHILVTTGYFDSQVQYWEPAKWVAKLRDMKTDDNMLLLATNMDAGHGGASGRFKRYKETAMQYAFFMKLEGINQ